MSVSVQGGVSRTRNCKTLLQFEKNMPCSFVKIINPKWLSCLVFCIPGTWRIPTWWEEKLMQSSMSAWGARKWKLRLSKYPVNVFLNSVLLTRWRRKTTTRTLGRRSGSPFRLGPRRLSDSRSKMYFRPYQC